MSQPTKHLLAMGTSSKLAEKFSNVTTHTIEQYRQYISGTWLSNIVNAYRDALTTDKAKAEKLKKQLPIRCAHYYHFLNDHRSQSDIDKDAFLFQTTIDIDDYPDGVTNEMIISAVKTLDTTNDTWRGKVLHIEYSASKKLHIDIRMLKGTTIEQSQLAFLSSLNAALHLSSANALHTDTTCFSPERCIFITGDEVYTSPHWYEILPDSELAAYRAAYPQSQSHTPLSPTPLRSTSQCDVQQNGQRSEQSPSFDTAYSGIPYSALVSALEEQLGGIPAHGARNNFIFTMACHLRYICDDNPDWIAAVLPQDFYGEARDKALATIRSACQRPQVKNMQRPMRDAIRICKMRAMTDSSDNVPPAMPTLPRAIRLLASKVPAKYKPCVANAVFPALAAHLKGVAFRYVNQEELPPSLMCVIMAKMSSGKSCVKKPIQAIMADIDARDSTNRMKEQEWKDRQNNKKANEKGTKRPHFIIQHLVSDMTNAAFVQRADDAQGHFLYTDMDEIEQLDQLHTNGKKSIGKIIRLAWDCSVYGQERVGSMSVTATPPLRWNFCAATTIRRGQNYFRGALVDGTLSRLNFCTIMTQPGEPIPIYGVYDDKFTDRLRPYIENLNLAADMGVIHSTAADKLVREMLAENNERFSLSGDEAFLQLSYRAVQIAYKKIMILYLMNGQRWERTFDEFFRWSVRYDLWCKMRFFGERLDDDISAETEHISRGPQNLLDMLSNRFSRNDVAMLRNSLGKRSNPMHMLSIWKSRGYIGLDQATGDYFKTPAYLDKHKSA